MQTVFKEHILRRIAGLLAVWIFVLSAGFSMHYLCNCMSLQSNEVITQIDTKVKSCCNNHSDDDQCCDDSFVVKMHIDVPVGNAHLYQDVDASILLFAFATHQPLWDDVTNNSNQLNFSVSDTPNPQLDFQILYQRFIC